MGEKFTALEHRRPSAIVAAVVFGVGHLPTAAALYGELTLEVVVWIIAGNAIGGLAFGWLFWKRSLEAADARPRLRARGVRGAVAGDRHRMRLPNGRTRTPVGSGRGVIRRVHDPGKGRLSTDSLRERTT